MSRSAMRGTIALAGLAVCLVAILRYQTILPMMCRWLDVGQSPVCAEHVLVLPGDETYRPVTAAALVNAGLATDILVPETQTSADVRDGLQPPTAVILHQILAQRGIPDDNIIFLDGSSQSTFQDADALLSFLEERPTDRVMVISNAFHTRRARFVFRRVLRGAADRLQFVSAPNPGFNDEDWWQHRTGARIVLSEYLKLAFYVLRYSNIRVWMSGLLLIAILWLLRWRQTEQQKRGLPRSELAAMQEDSASSP